jgi:hypothetical protein
MKGLFGVFRASGTAASNAPHVFIKADCDGAHMPMLQCNVNGGSFITQDSPMINLSLRHRVRVFELHCGAGGKGGPDAVIGRRIG